MGDGLKEALEKINESLQEIAALLKGKRTTKAMEKPAGSIVWDAYDTAYTRRYKTSPVRNKKTNALCKQLVDRLGADEAPQVAQFYLGHSHQLYVSTGHCLDLLIRDAEKLRMEWHTGRLVTKSGAQQAELRQTNVQAVREFLKTPGGDIHDA